MFRSFSSNAAVPQASPAAPVMRGAAVFALEPAAGHQAARPEPLGRPDVFWTALAVALTFANCYVLGHGRIPWEDEILGWMLILDPSWQHMIHAWQLGADGGGFTFYATARAWCAIFGHSVASLRAYAAAGFAGAFCLLWVAARRFYSTRTTAAALFPLWFANLAVITHMAEGRFYGLLMLGCTSVVWLLTKASTIRGNPASLCVAMFGAHALLSTSHMLGFVYSANLLAALCLVDWWNGIRRLPLYASSAAAWLLLIPEHTAIAASAAVGKPHFWTDPPTLKNFVMAYALWSGIIAAIACVPFAFMLLSLMRGGAQWRATAAAAFRARRPVYAMVAVLFLVPIEMKVESRFGPSLLLKRYLIPLAIAQALAAAELLALTDWSLVLPRFVRGRRTLEVTLAVAFALALCFRDFKQALPLAVSPSDYTEEITARLPHGIPVLCEDAKMFVELIARQPTSGVQYMYLLDWPQAVRPGTTAPEVTQYHLMENWQKAGYFSHSIEQREPFLQQHPKFLVLVAGYGLGPSFTTQASFNPLAERFAHDPAYQVIPYGEKGSVGVQDAWLVCRGGC